MPLKDGERRHERVNTCGECGECRSNVCQEVRQELRGYSGIRFTADGFDCALPVTIDSHSVCSYGCLYCFAPNLIQHRESSKNRVGQMSLKTIEGIFSGKPGKTADRFRKALKYDRRNKDGYPCPVQLGGLTDPCDNIERQQGWLLKFIDLAIKYNQPVRISTKGRLLQLPEYLDRLHKAPHLFWVAFSLITPDDEVLAKIDRRAPSATERLKTMAMLSKIGVKTSLRFRPILPGISDRTPNEPKAWKTLIHKAADAGACAISYEVAFTPGMATVDLKERWSAIESVSRVPMRRYYRSFGPIQACTRPAFAWTEEIMHSIADEGHECGMVLGVSDPVWKQLGDTGCCCGILPEDPVFGNWQEESATNQLLMSKWTGKEITLDDITPAWSRETRMADMVNLGVGPKWSYDRRHKTWADNLADIWNDLNAERGPMSYFQGALEPVRRDEDGNMVYRYKGLERQHLKAPYWDVRK